MIEKVCIRVDDEQLKLDMARYQEQVLALGATKAAIVKVTDIPVEDRVILKCQVPRCACYGLTANCPPNALKPTELREHLKSYTWAILFLNEVPSDHLVAGGDHQKLAAAYKKIFEIVTKVESMAFYDGHYLAFGFAAGSCKVYCGQQDCQALAGKSCRFPYHARPSMESVGIDVFKMVAKAGWEIYPIGIHAKASEVPKGTLVGIIIVE